MCWVVGLGLHTLAAAAAPERPLYHFTPRFGWTNDPNGLNFAPDSEGRIVQHLCKQHRKIHVNESPCAAVCHHAIES